MNPKQQCFGFFSLSPTPMNPERQIPQEHEYAPEISHIIDPTTGAEYTQEIRFRPDGKPKEVFVFNPHGEIMAYENVEALEKLKLEELQLKLLMQIQKQEKLH